MNIAKNPCKTISVEFTRQEEQWLVKFLEGRIKGSGTHDSEEVVDAVLAKLSDADRIALWLRENVIVNLTHEEVVQTLKTLEDALEELSSESSSPLAAIVRKLECVV